MKYIGAHVSAAGGVQNTPIAAHEIGAKAFALFTGSSNRWVSKEPSTATIDDFKLNCEKFGYTPDVILPHDNFLINLGTIIRTCHWFGVFDIYASFDTVDCYNPKVVQATMGSLGAVRVSYCNLKEMIESHRDMHVYGTLLNGENLFEAHPEPRGFIVMGNEGKGITDEMKRLLTQAYTIPPATSNHGESLNVAIATAIVLAKFSE